MAEVCVLVNGGAISLISLKVDFTERIYGTNHPQELNWTLS